MSSRRVVLQALILLVGCSLTGWSQDAAKSTTKGKAAEKKTTEKKTTNRLPANYGKLGLTEAQKDKVYAINDKYASQLDALEEQLKALRAKRGTEVEAVLTVEQKKILKDLTDDSQGKAAKSNAKPDDAKPDDAKPNDKDAGDAKPKK